ncbi:adenylate cyclase [Flavobacteriaceae bacterium MAR_2010_188]|nr:adenylate cyclase [Flavobacteriaceae bacterium MAR_2010_188]
MVFWTIAFTIFIVIRYFGIDKNQAEGFDSSYHIAIDSWLRFVLWLGAIIGTIFGTVEYIFDRFLSKKFFLVLILILKSVIYLVFLIFSLSFLSHFLELELHLDLPNESGWWQTSKTFWLVAGYFFFNSFLFLFFKMVNDKFGRNQLFNTLIGRYRRPREEKRIFMFIDLRSSTTIAEELGHYKYSQLIQDCFYDLNRIVGRYNASIYQYVGDEAVLSWPYKSGIHNNNCIDLFFAFRRTLNRRSRYYQRKYKLLPEFKVGVHGGNLIIAEVGSIKKEIAYHGDVINTTSRIQDQCNEYDKTFLISKELLDNIKLKSRYKALPIGELLLKGKQEPVKIYSIE